MAGVKGRSGTNKGQDKPFAEALRLEILDAKDDHKALRRVARALIEKAGTGDVQAIKEVADRLDGKSTQHIEANTTHRYVARLPNKEPDAPTWEAKQAKRLGITIQ